MSGIELDEKINVFLQRKSIQYPHIGLTDRDDTRTIKFPRQNRFVHSLKVL